VLARRRRRLPETIPAAHVAHRTAYRVRLRIPSRRHDRAFFTRLVAGLRACPAVSELEVNPATASVLLVDPRGVALDAVRSHAHEHGLFEMASVARPHVVQSVLQGARQVDKGLRRASGDQLDLRALAFLALLGGALYQLLRGDILAPAATLGWYAAAVLALPPRVS
jgi:hypothetical protein